MEELMAEAPDVEEGPDEGEASDEEEERNEARLVLRVVDGAKDEELAEARDELAPPDATDELDTEFELVEGWLCAKLDVVLRGELATGAKDVVAVRDEDGVDKLVLRLADGLGEEVLKIELVVLLEDKLNGARLVVKLADDAGKLNGTRLVLRLVDIADELEDKLTGARLVLRLADELDKEMLEMELVVLSAAGPIIVRLVDA
ncbi:unnamed protein product [Zymoseptoria tritici ST99CH_3D1]|nr:unnamed protein product [Zymoseptoria tritici ST99CH_3D1]